MADVTVKFPDQIVQPANDWLGEMEKLDLSTELFALSVVRC